MLHEQQVETNNVGGTPLGSVERCLGDSLVLLVQQTVKLTCNSVFQICVSDVGGTPLGSVERCLGDSLVLLVQQTVGKETIWLLPQAQWEAGETLRQTAERGLSSLPEADFKATFLGNTPCGVYRYKFPKEVRTERCVGAKVFFFKAFLSAGSASQKEPFLSAGSASQNEPFLWVKKTELQGYLKPPYLEKVDRFILNL
ncbi:39S ribosomal protein L46, mitochondrial-like [Oncorhynchus kisutch]|uniref:39S ribosomal protein L46, mitochondrial-like n=1 Tax=Oncorhynchus kisutch TaxID=8019 RepID=UPI0012DD5D63|nr:39S ribosomal protein L46, mitochondrial-like [Oncorhynchus kisutch]